MFQWKVIHSVKTFSDIKAFQILKRTRKSNLKVTASVYQR